MGSSIKRFILSRIESARFIRIGAQSTSWGPGACILPLDAIKLFGTRRKSDYSRGCQCVHRSWR